MTTRFESAVKGHAARLTAAAGVLITLKRGTSTTLAVKAVPAETRRDTQTFEGLPITIRTRDYIIKASDYLIGAVAVEPAEGDLIEETLGAMVNVYELVPKFGEPAWRWSDQRHSAYRVHSELQSMRAVTP